MSHFPTLAGARAGLMNVFQGLNAVPTTIDEGRRKWQFLASTIRKNGTYAGHRGFVCPFLTMGMISVVHHARI